MVRVKAGNVEGGVGSFREQQAGQRLHAALAREGFVLDDYSDGGRAHYQAVAAAVERQGRFRDILLGGGRAGGQEAGHGPFLDLFAGDIVGGYNYHALALAGAYPGFGYVGRLGSGGAGRAHVYGRALGPHPLGELAVRYRDHLQ